MLWMIIPCSRLAVYWRPEARASLEHVSRCMLSKLGSVAKHGMIALSPTRVRMLNTIDFLKGFLGSARGNENQTSEVVPE